MWPASLASGADEERCSRSSVRPDPHQRVNIGWTITEGEEVVQRTAHGATDGWLGARAVSRGAGPAGRIADFIVYLLSDRSNVVTGSIIDWDQIVIDGRLVGRAIDPCMNRRAIREFGVETFRLA